MHRARGVADEPDDGTLSPGAVAASLPFAPEPVTDTLRELVRAYPNLHSEYGLRASLNPTFGDWVSPLTYGLDQGPIAMMIENQRTGLLWNSCGTAPISEADCGRRDSPADGSNPNANRNARTPSSVDGAVAHAVQQIVRELDAPASDHRNNPTATCEPHGSTRMAIRPVSKSRQAVATRARTRTGPSPRESGRRELAGSDDRGGQGPIVARSPPAADIRLGVGRSCRKTGAEKFNGSSPAMTSSA